jgi:hypothetical protein
MPQEGSVDRRGIYNVEYFSGTQASVYIGDVWVDEITSISYSVQQSRTPLYGYADRLFRDVSEGQVLVQGQFSINFKEAGYLFLVLNRYRQRMRGGSDIMNPQPFLSSDTLAQQNIERLINNEGIDFTRMTRAKKNSLLEDLASVTAEINKAETSQDRRFLRDQRISLINDATGGNTPGASLGGFASQARASGGVGAAENIFETFEDAVWGQPQATLDQDTRRADDPRLNPFDLYVTFGDFAGDNSANHTIQKISQVHILGSAKQVFIDGEPIQEVYTFLARTLV